MSSMTTAGLVVLVIGIVVMVLAGRATAQQTRRAGADPGQGQFAYSWEGGVAKRTSAAMLVAWTMVIAGGALTIIGLI